jgi:hypothetical protein
MSVLWERVLLADAYTRDVLWVVSYNGLPPVLEKKHFFRDQAGEHWQTGKCRGLNGLDLAIALSCLEQYGDLLMAPWKSDRSLLQRPGGQSSPALIPGG